MLNTNDVTARPLHIELMQVLENVELDLSPRKAEGGVMKLKALLEGPG